RGEIVDAPEAAEALHPGAQRREIEQRAEILLDVMEASEHFVDGAEIRPMRLIERRQRPGLRAQPSLMTLGPGLLRRGEAPAVTQEEFGEAVARTQEIGTAVFATSEEIAGRFFLLRRNVDGGERASAIEDGEVPGVTAIRLDAIAGAPRDQRRGD